MLFRSRNLLNLKDNNQIELTKEGKEYANSLVRAHRLWESYLVHEMGMNAEHIHPEAEHFEHILTADQVDEVDKKLGYPALDPHGSPIPGKSNIPTLALVQLHASEEGIISQRQPGAEITYKLWDLGLGPGDAFRVISMNGGYILKVKEGEINVPSELARVISVEKKNA